MAKVPVVLFGCVHLGMRYSDKRMAQAYVRRVKEEKGFAILLGDNFECSIPGHKPETMWDQKETVEEQLEEAVELYKPIAKQVIGSCTSNHSARVYKATSIDLDGILANSLGSRASYKGPTGLVSLRLGRVSYKILINHGMGSGVNEWGDAQRALHVYPESDIVAVSHKHYCATREVGQRVNGKTRPVTFARTGSLMDYARYAQSALYAPQPKGFTILYLDPKDKSVGVDCSSAKETMRKYG